MTLLGCRDGVLESRFGGAGGGDNDESCGIRRLGFAGKFRESVSAAMNSHAGRVSERAA